MWRQCWPSCPGYFGWNGLIVVKLGTHLCGLFGINFCYHRLLTHRGLKCPKWLELTMVVVVDVAWPRPRAQKTASLPLRRAESARADPIPGFCGGTSIASLVDECGG